MTIKQQAAIYKALSNENRLEIFLSIIKSNSNKSFENCECVVSNLIEHLGIGAPTISHHLKELSNAGLIETHKDGKFLVARVNWEVVELQPFPLYRQ